MGCVRPIEVNRTEEGNNAGVLTTLHSFLLEGGTLRNNGYYLNVKCGGFYSGTSNLKQLALFFDSLPYNDTGLRDAAEPGVDLGWECDARIIRLSPTSIRTISKITAQFFGVISGNASFTAGGGFVIVKNQDLTVSNLDTDDIVMLVQGLGAAADDVVQNLTIIELGRN